MLHGSHTESRVLAPRSKLYQGPFGRIFSDLPPWSPFEPGHGPNTPNPPAPGSVLEFTADTEYLEWFKEMANTLLVEEPDLTKTPTDLIANVDQLQTAFGSSKIPAGYTYFGQFIDHDITFDPASSLMRQNDPSGLQNHRTPRFDLDNLYGSGPKGSPFLYCDPFAQKNENKWKFNVETIPGTDFLDLPRNRDGVNGARKTAIIGDPRNDENAMVSQLHLAFLLAHNRLVEVAEALDAPNPFESARTTLRWLYQYIVWNDFIKRIAIEEIRLCALKLDDLCPGQKTWELGLKDVYYWKHSPYIPIEFSVAAYRLGHSMVRNAYQTNIKRGVGNFLPIFDITPGNADLRGFRAMEQLNVIQWDWFLDMASSFKPLFPQMARKIDTKLSAALRFLPESEDEPVSLNNILAFRNLLRGWRFGLPSGSDVARKLGIEPINIDREHDALWFYILKEAETLPGQNGGEMLGRVGSTIVCATFAGLLKGDPSSYVNVQPTWTPDDDPLLQELQVNGIDGETIDFSQDPGDWTLAAIIRLSGLPVEGDDFGP